jgi:hypothetical protein
VKQVAQGAQRITSVERLAVLKSDGRNAHFGPHIREAGQR